MMPTAAMQLVTAVNALGDQRSSRTVNLIIAVLAGLGLLMLAMTLWLWKTSRPVPPHLEGLELITKRRWLRADRTARDQQLKPLRDVRGTVPISLARGSEPVVSGPDMPISVDAASTSLGLASLPNVAVVGPLPSESAGARPVQPADETSAAAASLPADLAAPVDDWPQPALSPAWPDSWPADVVPLAVPDGWATGPGQVGPIESTSRSEPVSAARSTPPMPPVSSAPVDNSYGESNG